MEETTKRAGRQKARPEACGDSPLGNVQPLLPVMYGRWSGTPGASRRIFDLNARRTDFLDDALKPWGQLIARTVTPNVTSIPFSAGFPDFDEAMVRITLSGYRDLECRFTFPAGQQLSDDRSANMYQADAWVAGHFQCSVSSVTDLRRDRHFTWHEEEDLRHMRLVVREIHAYLPHSGGINVLNAGGIGAPAPQGKLVQRAGVDWRVWEGHWSARRPRPGCAAEELLWTCIADDPAQGPTPDQWDFARRLEEQLEDILARAQARLTAYVEQEYPDAADWSAAPAQVIVYPGREDAGILYSFSLDADHGLGVRLCQGSFEAGSGDVAL